MSPADGAEGAGVVQTNAAEGTPEPGIRVRIDGVDYRTRPGRNVLEVALDHRLNLPYFCYHPGLGAVGSCRLCAVKQYKDDDDASGRVVMSCMTPAADSMRISIKDREASELRASVVEWLMTNHPHDCPVCDEGGECHLQDMTVMTGHGHRRYRGSKRTFENQDLGPLIHHEMNRCIHCYRCVRFYNDHAGGDDFGELASRNRVYFGRFEEGTLELPFAGNLVEVCPTGVFTDKAYRARYARKWDLQSAPSICNHCGLGCNTLPATSNGVFRRVTARYNARVNGYWLCDRGRFGFEHVNAPDRIRWESADELPAPGSNGVGKDAGRGNASATSAERLGCRPMATDLEGIRAARQSALRRATRAIGDAARRGTLAAVGSPSISLEANHALRRLAGEDRFCSGMNDVELRMVHRAVRAWRGTSIRVPALQEVKEADFILVIGCNPTHEAPLVDLEIVQACRAGAELAYADIRPGRLTRFANLAPILDLPSLTAGCVAIAEVLEGRIQRRPRRDPRAFLDQLPGERGRRVLSIADKLLQARQPLVIVGTQCRFRSLQSGVLRMMRALNRARRANAEDSQQAQDDSQRGNETPELPWYMLAVPEPNSVGVVMLEQTIVDDVAVPFGPPLGNLLVDIEEGRVTCLVVVGNDLYRRVEDVDRLRAALGKLESLIVIDSVGGEMVAAADVVLPMAPALEANGTFVSSEGRAQRYYQVQVPEPGIDDDWAIVRDLLVAVRPQSGATAWRTVEDVLEDLIASQPHFAPARGIAPPPGYRAAEQRVPRQTSRYSGRSARPDVVEARHPPRPDDDTESPLGFTMEGYGSPSPPVLVPRFWAPGWNSNEAINQFQIEVGGPLHGGDPGARLLEPGDQAWPDVPLAASGYPMHDRQIYLKDEDHAEHDIAAAGAEVWPEASVEQVRLAHHVVPSWSSEQGPSSPGSSGAGDAAEGEDAAPTQRALLLCGMAEIFGSEPMSSRAAPVSAVTPEPALRLHPLQARELGVQQDERRDVSFYRDRWVGRARLRIDVDAKVPPGTLLIPAGFDETRWWQQPRRVRVRLGPAESAEATRVLPTNAAPIAKPARLAQQGGDTSPRPPTGER